MAKNFEIFSDQIKINDCVLFESQTETNLEAPLIIGKPCSREPGNTQIGINCTIRSFSVIYEDVIIGRNVSIGHGALIRENNRIGDDCKIGSKAVLEPGNVIGRGSRIHTGCFLEAIEIGEDVFVGPNVVFTDDPHPPCPKYLDCKRGAKVKRFAKIGANSTILPGVIIGEHSLVGAGSVVVDDVADYTVVVGNPAKVIGDVRELNCEPGHFSKPYEWEPYSLKGDK